MSDCTEEKWGSPLVLRRCSQGNGASWERLSSADSAAAEGGCETGGWAAQHPHLDPWTEPPKQVSHQHMGFLLIKAGVYSAQYTATLRTNSITDSHQGYHRGYFSASLEVHKRLEKL